MSEPIDADDIEQLSFEEALTKLEEIVQQMDSGELQLEEAIEQFEVAMRLKKHCEKQLSEAEATIEELLEETDENSVTDAGE